MNNAHTIRQIAIPRRQKGVALVVALVLLLVVTVLGLASMRGTVLQERMTANTYDRSLAFQAAEAALREGERWVMENPPKPTAGACDGAGTCGIPDPADDPVWQDEDIWDEAHSATDAHAHTIDVGTLPVPPKFIVELLADSVPDGLWWMSSFGAGFSCHGALLEVTSGR